MNPKLTNEEVSPPSSNTLPLSMIHPNIKSDQSTRLSNQSDHLKPSAKQEAYRAMSKDLEKIDIKARITSGTLITAPPSRKPSHGHGASRTASWSRTPSFGNGASLKPEDHSSSGHHQSNLNGIQATDRLSEYMTPQQSEDALRELVEGMYEGDLDDVDTDAAMPEGLSCKLLPHQVVGVNWMKSREEGRKKGGILADDMGFGKTVQSIALISAHPQTEKGAPKTTLVVCPLALKDQWVDEIEQKSDLSVILYHGPKRNQIAHKLHKYRVVVTTYDVVSSEFPNPKKVSKVSKATNDEEEEEEDSDASAGKGSRSKKAKAKVIPLFTKADGSPMRFWRIILDEAHTIKNRNALKTKACCELKATYKWCLTGTPIQNGVEDIYPLLRFIGSTVKPFNDYGEFQTLIMKPMKTNGGKAAIVKIQALLKIILLRRSKESKDKAGNPLLKLPGKEVILLRTPFRTKEETEFYATVNERMSARMAKLAASGDVQRKYITILTLILRMRQATLHPSLGSEKADADSLEVPDTKASQPAEDLEDQVNNLTGMISGMEVRQNVPRCTICLEVLSAQLADASHCESCSRQVRLAKVFEGMHSSTKISRLLEILDEIKSEDPKTHKKTIVFSQFTSFLDLIEPFVKKAGYGFVRYDGAKTADEKTRALEKIKNDPACTVLLISLKCGSVGLNLTCCSRVILMDPWWNPSIENQAFDRSHRFGQREDVKCYKITIADTIEDRILQLQETKQSLANQALGTEAAKKMNKLSVAEIMYLFKG